MRFVQFAPDLAPVDKVIVDGLDCGAGLQLSHQPGNKTPAELQADLSVEMALRLARHPLRAQLLGNRDIVTNDHFDCDGVLSAYAVLRPQEALDHYEALIEAAETGDFFEFNSPRAVQFNLLVDAFYKSERSPVHRLVAGLDKRQRAQICTEAMLVELPDLLYVPERYIELWREPYGQLLDVLRFAQSAAVRVTEWPEERLSVIRTPRPLDDYARNLLARGHRILEVIETSGGPVYILHYRICLWYTLLSRPASPKYIFTDVARRLDEMESDCSGRWATTPWTPALRRIAGSVDDERAADPEIPAYPSTLAVDKVVSVLRSWLRDADSAIRSRRG